MFRGPPPAGELIAGKPGHAAELGAISHGVAYSLQAPGRTVVSDIFQEFVVPIQHRKGKFGLPAEGDQGSRRETTAGADFEGFESWAPARLEARVAPISPRPSSLNRARRVISD